MELLSVPFTHRHWTEAYDAVITVRGVVRTEEDGLALEFRRSEHSYGVKPSREDEIRTIAIPWAEIQSITYRPRFLLLGALVLRTRTLRALDGIPNAQGTELLIPVARRDRLNARELAVNVELALAEARLAALETPTVPRSLPSI
ncbi:MAG TPA: hypothetical protein VFR37_04435 [Longimicrobium sp.]|nr:hypothetical protein [Longimicrobium sp.]